VKIAPRLFESIHHGPPKFKNLPSRGFFGFEHSIIIFASQVGKTGSTESYNPGNAALFCKSMTVCRVGNEF
jgi:hypothetical protein